MLRTGRGSVPDTVAACHSASARAGVHGHSGTRAMHVMRAFAAPGRGFSGRSCRMSSIHWLQLVNDSGLVTSYTRTNADTFSNCANKRNSDRVAAASRAQSRAHATARHGRLRNGMPFRSRPCTQQVMPRQRWCRPAGRAANGAWRRRTYDKTRSRKMLCPADGPPLAIDPSTSI